ncbi:MAG: monovalent cation:proton antiporter-2 (CPA2) family protein [Halioglobus sp.]|nr:monovalent cation:proton antiporter-2 (CPA2) family protein [Halioglobus sp.]
MATHAIPYLRETIVFLVASGIIVPLLHRLRISPVLGFLLVGVVIGPYGLGLYTDRVDWLGWVVFADLQGVQALAELGVIFLMFMIGLDLTLDRLWGMRRLVFGMGSLQVLLTGAAIAAIAWGFGNGPAASIVLGACLALSSTAVVMQLLIEQRQLGTPVGRASFSILLMQDLAVVPILFLVSVLGSRPESNPGIALLGALGKAALVIAAIFVLGRVILHPLFHLAARTRSAEMFMAATLLIVLGCSAITGMAGLSMALGAFLAGLLLAETEFRHEIEVDVEPFKGLMLGLFFMSVGMGIDYRVVGQQAFWIAASVIGLFALKSTIIGGLCLAFGQPRHTAAETGLLLGQGGEFAFVVVGLAMGLDLVPRDVGQFMLIVTGLTMLVTPLVATAAQRVARKLEPAAPGNSGADVLHALAGMEGHMVICGFGRIGHTLGRALDADGIPYIALESDAAAVRAARARSAPVYYGDASRPEILQRAHADKARGLLVTMDNPLAAEKVVRAARAQWPHLPIIARAHDTDHAARLLALGATDIILETIEAGLQFSVRVLELAGIPEDIARRRIDCQREEVLASMRR